MAKYRKKLIVVDAEQWDPRNNNIPKPGRCEMDRLGVVWQYGPEGKLAHGRIGVTSEVYSLTGLPQVNFGDWIITKANGEKEPCKPDKFAETYEELED